MELQSPARPLRRFNVEDSTRAKVLDLIERLKSLGKESEQVRDDAIMARNMYAVSPHEAADLVTLRLLPRALSLEATYGGAFQICIQTMFVVCRARSIYEYNLEDQLGQITWWITLYENIADRAAWLVGIIEGELDGND